MRGMGKWLCVAYIVVMLIYAPFHSWTLSWPVALWAGSWIFIGGGAMITAFAELCRKASMPRPAGDYLGKDGQVRMPLEVKVLTWSAYAVFLVGSALILYEIFS
jgi:hypothetical protein